MEENKEENSVHEGQEDVSQDSQARLGEKLFKLRDYTPIPLIVLLLIFASPTVVSATLGILIVVLGELIRIYSVAFIGSISRTRKNRTGGALINSGPFAYVRNPLYVGNFFISFGLACYGGNIYIVMLTVLLFAFQYYFIVKYEESLLVKTFGDEYKRYCEDVPPWFPRKSIRLSELAWPDSFADALKSERKTLMAIAAVLLLLMLLA